ncbi:TPA: hypothetical protein PXN96_003894 [Yersinia enterocolitica]|uniref:hypothetical protein n=1 Tax=Yersinia enterocolitica TaxID=630 RepID=UPI0005DDD520|nr:hypothetical protein [Yersinia enterocolitica]EKN6195564.1 hypothetical protein [Yersinia enterocolitica]CNF22612.1 phage protein [Yersinia enterocolitica]HDL7488881.1 hypothetical protein [Yersinia enterocolitica]
MAINYPRMRATATRLLTENGIAYQLTRGGGVEFVGGVEVDIPLESFSVIGVISSYSPGEIDGTLIQNGDVKMSATADVEIRIGDLIMVDGKKHRVIKPNPVKPAALLICYKPQLRA